MAGEDKWHAWLCNHWKRCDYAVNAHASRIDRAIQAWLAMARAPNPSPLPNLTAYGKLLKVGLALAFDLGIQCQCLGIFLLHSVPEVVTLVCACYVGPEREQIHP